MVTEHLAVRTLFLVCLLAEYCLVGRGNGSVAVLLRSGCYVNYLLNVVWHVPGMTVIGVSFLNISFTNFYPNTYSLFYISMF